MISVLVFDLLAGMITLYAPSALAGTSPMRQFNCGYIKRFHVAIGGDRGESSYSVWEISISGRSHRTMGPLRGVAGFGRAFNLVVEGLIKVSTL